MLARILHTLFAIGALASAVAQLPSPRLDTLYPCGGKAGTTVEVTLSGAALDRPSGVSCSHAGITATPMTTPGNAFLPEVQDEGRLRIQIAGDVPPGVYALRVVGYYGVSNPRAFVVSDRGESVAETNATLETAMTLTPEMVVNARAEAGKGRYFRFAAKAGEPLSIEVLAQRIDSAMEAQIVLFDASGRELKRAFHSVGGDPVLDFAPKSDGEYVAQVSDFLSGGGAAHVYRVRLLKGPRFAAALPPVAKPGTRQKFTLLGGEGSRHEVEVDVPTAAEPRRVSLAMLPEAALKGFHLEAPGGPRIFVPFIDEVPAVEVEPNDEAGKATPMTLPIAQSGVFSTPIDSDWLAFDAKKGQVIWLEALSDRLHGGGDPALRVHRLKTDDKGVVGANKVAESDDDADNPLGLKYPTASRDPVLLWTVPEDGRYALQVFDQFGASGADKVYHLHARVARADFSLLATLPNPYDKDKQHNIFQPALRRGDTMRVSVTALRREGFNGAIALNVEGLPDKVSAAPAMIAAGQKGTTLLLTAAMDAPPWTGAVRIVGRAKVGDQELVREAKGGYGVRSVGNYESEAVVARAAGLRFAVIDTEAMPLVVAPKDPKVLESCLAGKIELPVSVTRAAKFKDKVKVRVVSLPGMAKAPEIVVETKDAEGKLTLHFNAKDNNKYQPGEFQFQLQGSSKIGYRARVPEADKLEALRKEVEAKAGELTAASQAAVKSRDEAKQALAALAQKDLTDEANKQAMAGAQQSVEAAEKAVLDAQAKAKEAEQAKGVAAERAKQAAARAKERDVLVTVYSAPITLRLASGPAKVDAVEPPQNVARGAGGDLVVKFQRLFGFDDAVEWRLAVPDSLKTVTAAAVSVPKEQSEARLAIQTKPETPAGDHALTVIGKMKLNGQDVEVKQGFTLKVVEPAAANENQ